MGPVTPKCVNIISPKSVYTGFFRPSSNIFSPTFFRDSPMHSAHQLSRVSSGTRDGTQGVTSSPA